MLRLRLGALLASWVCAAFFGCDQVAQSLAQGHDDAPTTSRSFDGRGRDYETATFEEAVSNLDAALTNADFSFNRITRLAANKFKPMPSLRSLKLNDNRIASLANASFAHLDNLNELDLSSNYIASLDESAFDNLTKLRELNLSRNNIGNISLAAFANLAGLVRLDLSDNKELTWLSRSHFRNLTKLEELNLCGTGLFADSPFATCSGRVFELLGKLEPGITFEQIVDDLKDRHEADLSKIKALERSDFRRYLNDIFKKEESRLKATCRGADYKCVDEQISHVIQKDTHELNDCYAELWTSVRRVYCIGLVDKKQNKLLTILDEKISRKNEESAQINMWTIIAKATFLPVIVVAGFCMFANTMDTKNEARHINSLPIQV